MKSLMHAFGLAYVGWSDIWQQVRRLWELRQLRNQWADDMSLRKIAKQREWAGVLDFMNTESRYRLIKLFARIAEERGHL